MSASIKIASGFSSVVFNSRVVAILLYSDLPLPQDGDHHAFGQSFALGR